MSEIKRTAEQVSVIDVVKQSDGPRICSVDALPGSGKTTLLSESANEIPDKKILYLVFNDHNAREAQEKLGPNVDVYSFHKLAHRMTLGSRQKDSPSKKVVADELDERELVNNFIDSEIDGVSLPLGNFSSDELMKKLATAFVETDNLRHIENTEEAESFISETLFKNPLLVYLNEKFSILKERERFNSNLPSFDSGTYPPFIAMSLELFFREQRDSTNFSGELLECVNSITNKALEMGNLEVKPEYFERSVAWVKGTKTLADLMCVDIKLDINNSPDTKQFKKFANKIIEGMANSLIDHQVDMSNNGSITHGAYLAEFSNSNKPFQLGRNYDYVFLDEAQDTNNACWNVIRGMMYGNKKLRLLMVGDEHQSIYGFRHAKNVLEESPLKDIEPNTDAFVKMPLTKVFRVGGEVSDIANAIIKLRHNDIKRKDKIKHQSRSKKFNLNIDLNVCETPLYVCDPSDPERGKIIPSVLKTSVVDALKKTPGGTPAILCANNLDTSKDNTIVKGVFREAIREALLGNKVNLMKNGSAYDNILLMTTGMRFSQRNFKSVESNDELKKIHEAAYQTVLKELSIEFSSRPGYLLGSKFKGKDGEKKIHDDLVLHFGESLYKKSTPISSVPAITYSVFERFIKAGLLNQLTKQSLTANITTDKTLIEDMLNAQQEGLGDDRKALTKTIKMVENYRMVICRDLLKQYASNQSGATAVDSGIQSLLVRAKENIADDYPNASSLAIDKAVLPFKEILMKAYTVPAAEIFFGRPLLVSSHMFVDKLDVYDVDSYKRTKTEDVAKGLLQFAESNKTDASLANRITPEMLTLVVGGQPSMNLGSIPFEKVNEGFTALSNNFVLDEFGLPNDSADLIIGTVHKTKGLEYPVVALSEDILVPDCDQSYNYNFKEKWNAALIASTRATHGMILNSKLEEKAITLAGTCPISTKLAIDVFDEGARGLNNLRNKGLIVVDGDITTAEVIELGVKSKIDMLEKISIPKPVDDDNDRADLAKFYSVVNTLTNAKDEIVFEALSNIANDIASSANQVDVMNKVESMLSPDSVTDLGLKSTLQRDFDGLENGQGVVQSRKSFNNGFQNVTARSPAAIYTIVAGNEPVEYTNLMNGQISTEEYLKKRNIPSLLSAMDSTKQVDIYDCIIKLMTETATETKRNGQNGYKHVSDEQNELNQQIDSGIALHLINAISDGRRILSENKGDYKKAFSDQLSATLSDKDAYINKDEPEQRQQQQNKQKLVILEKEYKKIKFAPGDKTPPTGISR